MRTALPSAVLAVVLGGLTAAASGQQDPRPSLQGSVERLDQSLHRMDDYLQELRRAELQKQQAPKEKEHVRDAVAAKDAEVGTARTEGVRQASALQTRIEALEKECSALRAQVAAGDAARAHDAQRSRQALDAARSAAQEAAARDAAAQGRLAESMQELLRLRQTVADLRAETERCLADARQHGAATATSTDALGGLRRAFAAELDDLGRVRAQIGDLLHANRAREDEESAAVRDLRDEVHALRTAAENLRRRTEAGRRPL